MRPEMIMVGLVIALFWYFAMWSMHGGGALGDFFSDQVTTRVEHNTGSMAVNFSVYLYSTILNFMPWTLLVIGLVACRWREALDLLKRRRTEWLFLVLLFAILMIVFSMGNMLRPRYLVASFPLLALLLADIIAAFSGLPRLQQTLGRLMCGILYILLPLGVLLLVAGLIEGYWRLIVGGGILLSLAVTGWRIRNDKDDGRRWLWLAGVSLGIFALIGGCIRPVFSPPPLESAAKMLKHSAPGGGTIHTLGLNYTETGVLRVLTGGLLDFKELRVEQAAGQDLSPAPIVLTTSPHEQELAAAGYRITKVTEPGTPFENTHYGQLVKAKARRSHNRPVPEYWIAMR